MGFVGGAAEVIGLGINMLDSGIGDASRRGEFANGAIGIVEVDGASNGRINENLIAFQMRDDALHINIIAAGAPRGRKLQEPNSKLQRRSKFQTSNSALCRLELGI